MTTTPGTESQEWRSALTYQDIAEALQPHLPVPLPDREAVHVNPNGTFEISYISVGPRKDGKQKGITRGVTGR